MGTPASGLTCKGSATLTKQFTTLTDIGPGYAAAPTMTVIIPIRITDARRDLVDRIHNYLIDSELPDDIDVIVVDDGSRDEDFYHLSSLQSGRLKVIRTGRK
jgi:cellulose synthase/poly-beta-1,6-N-acetylglucosamine synthase-like glycosyltransferase